MSYNNHNIWQSELRRIGVIFDECVEENKELQSRLSLAEDVVRAAKAWVAESASTLNCCAHSEGQRSCMPDSMIETIAKYDAAGESKE